MRKRDQWLDQLSHNIVNYKFTITMCIAINLIVFPAPTNSLIVISNDFSNCWNYFYS